MNQYGQVTDYTDRCFLCNKDPKTVAYYICYYEGGNISIAGLCKSCSVGYDLRKADNKWEKLSEAEIVVFQIMGG